MPQIEVTDELCDKYDDPVVQSLLRNNCDYITKEPFTHESLLIDRKDYRLTKAEKNLARLSYEREKKMNVYGYTRPSYAGFYAKGANANKWVTSNIRWWFEGIAHSRVSLSLPSFLFGLAQ